MAKETQGEIRIPAAKWERPDRHPARVRWDDRLERSEAAQTDKVKTLPGCNVKPKGQIT
jgi:hypothetical protein